MSAKKIDDLPVAEDPQGDALDDIDTEFTGRSLVKPKKRGPKPRSALEISAEVDVRMEYECPSCGNLMDTDFTDRLVPDVNCKRMMSAAGKAVSGRKSSVPCAAYVACDKCGEDLKITSVKFW